MVSASPVLAIIRGLLFDDNWNKALEMFSLLEDEVDDSGLVLEYIREQYACKIKGEVSAALGESELDAFDLVSVIHKRRTYYGLRLMHGGNKVYVGVSNSAGKVMFQCEGSPMTNKLLWHAVIEVRRASGLDLNTGADAAAALSLCA